MNQPMEKQILDLLIYMCPSHLGRTYQDLSNQKGDAVVSHLNLCPTNSLK